MDDIIKDFLIESNENLDRLDQELVQLESDPTSRELLDSIFRTIHTIKGSCGFLGFSRLEKVAHAGENLLSKLREGQLTLNCDITSGLLAMVDAVRRMLAEIQATERDGENDYPDLLSQLKALQESNRPAEAGGDIPAQGTAEAPAGLRIVETSAGVPPVQAQAAEPAPSSEPTVQPQTASPTTPAASATPEHLRPCPSKIGGVLVDRGSIEPAELAIALQEQEHDDRRCVGEILASPGFCRPEDVQAAQRSVSRRVNLIVTAVQQQVMKTRMQPIGNVWNKFPRKVRDLALSCGKEVQLEMQGQDTELDRTIIEAIKDPLTHLVRKAIDHGIEAPDARRSAGKDPAGRLVLRAFDEGGRVKIEIQDDGPGLNADRLLKKAIERGLVQEHQAKTMAERDVFNLIFLPGFSTAEKVTKVDQANTVSQAAQQVSQNLEGVSAGGEEMTATIQSIASNSHDAATIASKAACKQRRPPIQRLENLANPVPRSAKSSRSSLRSRSKPSC